MTLTFFVEGKPKGQPRTRSSKKTGRHWTPSVADEWKACVRDTARDHRTAEPISGPMEATLVFVMPRPATKFKKRDGDGRQPHTSTPDVDNLIKAVFDAMVDIGFMTDDKLVYRTRVEKWYAAVGERTGCLVTVEGAA